MKRPLRAALQIALLGFVAWYIARHWTEYRLVLQSAHPVWGQMAQASFLVLLAYVVLIQTWRQAVNAWGERLSFGDATRIWFVSNLGKYVPGKVWAIAAMGTLAQEAGVSPVAAMGSSVVIQLVNLVTGFGVFFVAGAKALDVPSGAVIGVALLGAALVAAPWLVPYGVRAINMVTRRNTAVPTLPHSAIWWAGAGTTLAWLLYGLAFQWFAASLAGSEIHGTFGDWTALFVGPYLLGFIAVFSPGGLGVREVFLAEALQRTGLATTALAALIVAGSRLWLTVLEIIPGALFLLVKPLPQSAPPRHRP